MKVLNKFVSVFVSSLLLSGIASAQDNPEFKPELESIYDNIILKNASIASQNCRQLEEKIKLKVQDPTNTDYADKFWRLWIVGGQYRPIIFWGIFLRII